MKLKRKNSQGIWESVAPSQKEFDTFKTESTAQLAEKVGGEKKATMDDLGQDVKEALTGGAVAVVGKGAVGTVNYQTKSLTPEKTTFVSGTSNLFNPNDPEIRLDKSVTFNGTVIDSVGYLLSGKIPVSAGDQLTLLRFSSVNDASTGAYYDYADNHISNVTGVTNGNTRLISVPDNQDIAYMKVNQGKTSLPSIMVVSGTVYPQTYIPYAKYLDESFSLNEKQKSEVIALGGGSMDEFLTEANNQWGV